MTRPLDQIAAQIAATGKPLEACVSLPFSNGFRATVWGDRISPADYARLRELLAPKPASSISSAQYRAIAEAEANAERRRRRR